MNLNGAHWHLMLVHFPIAGTILAIPLLLAAGAMKNQTVKLVGLALMVAVGILTWVTDQSGEWAAHVVRNMPDITRDSIHEHAEAADWALRSLGATGLIAAYGLFAAWKKKKLPDWVFVTVTVLTIFSSTVVVRVAYLGGQIHHPETRADFVAPTPGPAPAAPGK